MSLIQLAEARSATLGTICPDGSTHLVPCVFAVVGDQIITAVDHKPKSSRRLKRLENITYDSRVTLLADYYDDDWNQLWWVRADGTATVANDPPDILEALVAKYQQYQERPPEGPFIIINVANVVSWSAI